MGFKLSESGDHGTFHGNLGNSGCLNVSVKKKTPQPAGAEITSVISAAGFRDSGREGEGFHRSNLTN